MKIFRIMLVIAAVTAAGTVLTGCSPAERSGVNPKPFNAPASWEYQPYDGAFQN